MAVITFVAGFKLARRKYRSEGTMHRMDGFIVIAFYLVIAALCIADGTSVMYLLAWILGFLIHLLKIFVVQKKLGPRYGGYVGTLLMIVWLTLIFTHLPK